MDRLRASGQTGFKAGLPRHKPDPTDLSKEFVDMQWTPPAVDDATLRAMGGGNFPSIGGGQSANIAPPGGNVSGAEFLPDPGEGFRPSNPEIDALRARAARQPYAVAERAGDADLRQSLAQGDAQHDLAMFQNLSPEQQNMLATAARSNPMFAQALAVRLGNPKLAVGLQRLFGPRQTPPLPQTGPTVAAAPPPQVQPNAMAMYAQNGQGQPQAAPQAMGTPRERSGTGAAPPTRNALSMYAN